VSGANEHFLPQLIQRGFLLPGEGEFTFQVTRERSGKRPIKRVGSASYFNSGSKSGKTIDDELGKFENKIGPTFDKWRKSHGEVIYPKIASEVIMHFAIRGRYLRESFTNLVGIGFDHVFGKILDKKYIIKHIQKQLKDETSDLRRQMHKELIQQGRFGEVLRESEELLINRIIENIDEAASKMIEEFRRMLPILDNNIPSNMAKMHGNISISDFSTGLRFKKLMTLEWQIKKIKEENFILPDCVAIVVPKSGPSGPLFLWDREVPHCVVMPISNENLLIGGLDLCIDPSNLNAQLASCATTFYLSSLDRPSKVLSELIGQRGLEFKKRMTASIATIKL
jgi:Protein of unknown function (DUF4238)